MNVKELKEFLKDIDDDVQLFYISFWNEHELEKQDIIYDTRLECIVIGYVSEK